MRRIRTLRRLIRTKRIAMRLADWLVNLTLFAFGLVVLWLISIVFFVSSFKIPTDSMQPTLQPGDNILVQKLTMGARLFHVWDALDGKKVSIHRLPGLGRVERNDVLVFNFPLSKDWSHIHFDVMLYYAKRCVALPGDTLEVRNSMYRVRGTDKSWGDTLQQIAMRDIRLKDLDGGVAHWNPRETGWTLQEAGPLLIPAQGSVVRMNHLNALLYRHLINWEQGGKELTVSGDTVRLDGEIIRKYCFLNNYYFMAGDNCLNSMDSRYWGLVPEEFIVGKAWIIWRSIDPWKQEFRWDRFLKQIR